jgi:hypothetical protein
MRKEKEICPTSVTEVVFTATLININEIPILAVKSSIGIRIRDHK